MVQQNGASSRKPDQGESGYPVYFQRVSYIFFPLAGIRAGGKSRRTGMAYTGGEKYLAWHNALYATGKVEGALTEQDVYTLAQHYLTPKQLAVVKEAQSRGAVHDALLTNQALAQHMDFSGTPAFVVMPQTQNGDVKRVAVIPGSTTQDMLQMAIQKAKG